MFYLLRYEFSFIEFEARGGLFMLHCTTTTTIAAQQQVGGEKMYARRLFLQSSSIE